MQLFFPLLFLLNVVNGNISLTSQSINVEIENRYAFITYSFEFINNANNSSQLSYQIQLEPNTFISYFYAELNGFVFRGETKEKLEAQREYDSAVELGLNAVLISQNHNANVFNIRTNIAANDVAVLNITAEQFMLRRFGYYELALTVTNEYEFTSTLIEAFTSTLIATTIKDESGISYTDVIVPTNVNYDINQQSIYQYDINMTVDKLMDDTSSTQQQQQQLLIRYKTDTMEGHNQFTFDAHSLTFLHIFSYEDEAILARRVVFVLDRSGSMGTSKWEKAVAATKGAIDNLKPGIDRMNIILFDDEVTKYRSSMIQVTASIISNSKSWISEYKSDGSTNIYQAVIDALALIKNDIDALSPFAYVNQIILITDGSPTAGVTNPTDIQTGILNANEQLQPAQAAIFCLGIGSDSGTSWVASLNYPILRGIATQNGGFDARVKESETETILSEYYDILESPVMAYIALQYTNIDTSTLTQNTFRCLYEGTDIVVAGKFADNSVEDMEVSLFGYTSGETVEEIISIDIDWNEANDGYVAERMWAYLKLLTYRRTLDNPLLEVLALAQGKTYALELALEHELVTQWTSMIAVAYEGVDIANITDNDDDGYEDDSDIGDIVYKSNEDLYAMDNVLKYVVIIVVVAVVIILVIVSLCCYKKRKGKLSGEASFKEAINQEDVNVSEEELEANTKQHKVEMIAGSNETTSCIMDQD